MGCIALHCVALLGNEMVGVDTKNDIRGRLHFLNTSTERELKKSYCHFTSEKII
jgi:hypothetical protein